jgi:signal transduction histidine kinase
MTMAATPRSLVASLLTPPALIEGSVALVISFLSAMDVSASPEYFATWLSGPASTVVALWSAVAGAIIMWRPRWGLWASVVPILAPFDASNGLDVGLLGLLILAVTTRETWHWIVGTVVAMSTLVALRLPHSSGPVQLVALSVVVTVMAAGGGAVSRHLARRQRGDATRIAALERANAHARAFERANLARELHDLVAHQLSIISLQVMGYKDSSDIDELSQTLARVGTAAETALDELLLLVGTKPMAPLPEGSPRAPHVVDVADDLVETLRANGYAVEATIDPAVDDLGPDVRRTSSRVLQESVTNILKHTPAGGLCHLSVTLTDDDVIVGVSSPATESGRLTTLPGGLGLRGLAERVDLSDGEFDAGRQGGSWVVTATLPKSA